MKICTVVGTRPELIRLSIIIKKLDKLVDHVLVYTNQNYTYSLSTQFFEDLCIRSPDYTFREVAGFAPFLSNALLEFDDVLIKEQPDKILILGDTNSGLVSLVAAKHNIPMYHMEAGSRCFDNRVPEETNRRVIDSLATYNLPYTENSKDNLLKEGYHKNFVFKTGNPILEVLDYYDQQILDSHVMKRLSLHPGGFVLVTAHRAENVDNPKTLLNIMRALNTISKKHKVIYPIHPRTKSLLDKTSYQKADGVHLCDPLGLFDFVNLEQNAKLVVSDSGTVQEECSLFGVPSITIRETTERQETIECGSNVLSGTSYSNIIRIFDTIINRESKVWHPPEDYLIDNVSDIVINILLGKNQ